MVHKNELLELTMTRAVSKASRLFECIDFYLSGTLANIHACLTAVTIFTSF